jgi:hypothetical protein
MAAYSNGVLSRFSRREAEKSFAFVGPYDTGHHLSSKYLDKFTTS